MSKDKPKLIDTIICDDVRHELGNKISYMGIYRKDIYIEVDLPVKLSKLCLIQKWSFAAPPKRIKQQLWSQSEMKSEISFENIQAPPDTSIVTLQAVYQNLQIDELGEYQLRTYFDDVKDDANVFKFSILNPKNK